MTRRPRWRRSVRTGLRASVVLLIGIPVLVVAAGAGAFGLLLYGELPGTVPEPHDRVVSMPSVVVDSTGKEIGSFHEYELTVAVKPSDVPQVMKEAVVAAEDRHFWEHDGVDVRGLARAAVTNMKKGEIVEGGSTITQQLVKNRYLSGERSIGRKLDEAVLAMRLEREMSKDQILFEYLDTTYFGGGAYGVGAAAKTYFHKSVHDLTASEAATIAGLVPAPSAYGPRENPAAAEDRRQLVLGEMHEQGFLTGAQYSTAKAEKLWSATLGAAHGRATVFFPAPGSNDGPYPYFLDYVRRYLVDEYGADKVFRGGLRVETTLDPTLQDQAQAAIAARLDGTQAPLDMTLVSVEPATGHVKAFVGGRDWKASQVNLALGGSLGMQAGSAFKPFVLATALERGLDPDTVYAAPSSWQVPGCVGSQCTVHNYSGSGYGSMSIRRATWSSVNTVFAQMTNDLGPTAVAETASRVGIDTLDPKRNYGVTLALGSAEVSPLDMAGAYATFAAHGVRAGVTPVLRVVGPDGQVLEDNTAPGGKRVMDPAVADTVTDVLTGVVQYGTGTGAAIGRPVAGKTGTAEDYRAAWFVGYTPQLATSVWMGYADEPRSLRNIGGYSTVTGGSLPAMAWAQFMRAAHEGLPIMEFPTPGPLPIPGGEVSIAAPPRKSLAGVPTACGGLCEEKTTTTTATKAKGKTKAKTKSETSKATTTTTNPKGADDG